MTTGYPSSWHSDGLHREVFFLPSGLYGSTYAGTDPPAPRQLIVCPSWGSDARLAHEAQHQLALRIARLGGTITLFDYPGHGESTGTIEEVAFLDLLEAALELTEARGGRSVRWVPVGVGLGACVAFLLAERLAADRIGLLQPALDPGRYFSDVRRRGARGGLQGTAVEDRGVAMGVPITEHTISSAAQATPAVLDAIRSFVGMGVCIRFERPEMGGTLPTGIDEHIVSGTWGLAHRLQRLVEVAVEPMEGLIR